MSKEEQIKNIIAILQSSDIVWGRYGTDSIEKLEKLAEKIVNRLDESATK